MKKLIVTAFLIVATFVLVSCVEISTVTSIELNWTPKVEFVVGEEVELDDKVVTINFDDNSSQDFAFSNSAIEKVSGVYQSGGTYYLDTRAAGEYSFRMRYEDSMISIQYRVVEGIAVIEVGSLTDLTNAMNGETPVLVKLTASIELTSTLSTTRFMGIDTNDHTLTLTDHSLNVNIPSETDERRFDDMPYELKGTFIGGTINISSVFKNSPNVDYDFDIDVVSTTVFDTVYLEPGNDAAGAIQSYIDDDDTKVLLLGNGIYQFEKAAEAFIRVEIDRAFTIIGTNDLSGSPVTVIKGNSEDTTIGMIYFMAGDFDANLYNLHLTGFADDSEKVGQPYTENDKAFHGIALISTFEGTAQLDNLIIDRYNRKAITHQGGNLIIKNSVIDFGQEVPQGWMAYGIFSNNSAQSLYVNNTSFYGCTTTDAVHQSGYHAAAIMIGSMNNPSNTVIQEIKNNIFVGNDIGIGIENNNKNTNSVSPGAISGNTFINNNLNAYLYTNFRDVSLTETDLANVIAVHNSYPYLGGYDDNYAEDIRFTTTLTLNQHLTLEHGDLVVGSNDTFTTLTIASGVTFTLGENARLVAAGNGGVTHGTITNNGTIEYAAYYVGTYLFFPIWTKDNSTIYVGSIDLIPEGTTYYVPDGQGGHTTHTK